MSVNNLFIYLFIYFLRLLAKSYEELLDIRLGKTFDRQNPRHASYAPFLCSPLLTGGVLPLPFALPTIEKPAC